MDAKQLFTKIVKKIARAPARAKQLTSTSYDWVVHQLALVLTERYWLIDYLPRLSRSHGGVMLVRLDLIGDFIIWLDSAKEFKSLYPNQRIVLFANAAWASVAEQLPYWDEVVAIDVPRLRADDWYRVGVLIQLHQRRFDVAIQPTYSREYVGDLCARAANCAQCIAHFGDTNNTLPAAKAQSDAWYTQLVPEGADSVTELTHNANLIRHLGKLKFKSRVPRLDRLGDLPPALKIDAPYCVVVPGASWLPKMWPSSNFGLLAAQISQKLRLTVVLCGTSAEKKICDQVASLSGVSAINLAGKTTLIEIIELIRGAQFVVANDSAAIHIAAATNVRAVCILGGGHFGRFLPYEPEITDSVANLPKVAFRKMDCYSCNWRCHYLDRETLVTVPCVSEIEVSDVLGLCGFE